MTDIEIIVLAATALTSGLISSYLVAKFFKSLGRALDKRLSQSHEAQQITVKLEAPPLSKRQVVQDTVLRIGLIIFITAVMTYLPLSLIFALVEPSVALDGLKALFGEGPFTKPHLLAIAEIVVVIVLIVLIVFLIIVPLSKTVRRQLSEQQPGCKPMPMSLWGGAVLAGVMVGSIGAVI